MEKSINKLYTEIQKHKKIIIHRHKRADLDAVCSQMALKHYIIQNFPDKKVYAVSTDDTKSFEFIMKKDKVSPADYNNGLVIVLDTANPERIDGIHMLELKNLNIIKIDHHPNETPYGKLMIVDEKASSTSEMLFYIFKQLNESDNFVFNDKIMQALFCGIYGDTGGFKFQNTRSNTFIALSEIVKYDIHFEDLITLLSGYDEDIVRVIGYAYMNFTIEDGVGYIIFDEEFQKSMNVPPAKLSIIVNLLGIFNNVRAWAVFNENIGFIRVNLRSKGSIDISSIAMKYNGGGHINASGAMIYEWHEVDNILNQMAELVAAENISNNK